MKIAILLPRLTPTRLIAKNNPTLFGTAMPTDPQPPAKRGRGRPKKPPEEVQAERKAYLTEGELAAFLAKTKAATLTEGVRAVIQTGTRKRGK